MGAICSCQFDVSHTMLGLKAAVKGKRRQVNSSPEVYVTIEDIELEDNGSITFSPEKFSFNDMRFQARVELKGTAAELAGVAAAKGAAKLGLPSKVSSVSVKAGEKVSRVSAACAAIAHVAQLPKERSFHVGFTIDMMKEFDVEKVIVKLKDFKTHVSVFDKFLDINLLRHYVELAVSHVTTEVVSKMANKKIQKLSQKLGIS